MIIALLLMSLPTVFLAEPEFTNPGEPTRLSGTLKLNFDQMVYSDTENNLWLEFSYEIPFTSLSFIKTTTDSAKFLARYRFLLEFYEKGKNITASEIKESEKMVSDYSLTIKSDSFIRDVMTFPVPPKAVQAKVLFSDLFSERTATFEFAIKRETSRLLLRLLKSGRPNPSRTYRFNDTVVVLGEMKNLNSPSTGVRFTVKKDRRNIFSDVFPLTEKNGEFQTLFILPVNNSESSALLHSGEYTVEASLIPMDTIIGMTWFRVEIPFYSDDSLWQIKVDQLIYIATGEEIKKLKKTQRGERKEAWEAFWRPKDPNSSTEINEYEEEYFQRIAYCEKNFRRGDRGYRSDRAKIYVTYGPPDQIESRPFNIDRPAEEIWYYYQINRTFTFVDRFGSGEYVLSDSSRG